MSDNKDGIQYVKAIRSRINNNNNIDYSPYSYWNMTDDVPFQRLANVSGMSKVCDFCYREFEKYNDLYTHKAHPCYLDEKSAHTGVMIRVSFPKGELIYVEDFFCEKGIVLEKEGDSISFVVDKADFEITMRQMYFCQISKYNIEQWYESLSLLGEEKGVSYTPRTRFVFLNDEEIDLIKQWSEIELSKVVGMEIRPTQENQSQREKMEDRIDKIMMDENGSFETDYFVRSSTRSPKDAVNVDREQYAEMSEVERITSKMEKLKVRNGMEVFDLITRSQRIFSDILGYMQYRVPNTTSIQFNLIIRDWKSMPQDHEFRCYVLNKQMTSISQYHCFSRFESLQNREHVKLIKEAVISFHNEIRDVIPVPSYVIDIAVFSDYSCQVIELNPFGAHQSSGSALYNWIDDYDTMYGNTQEVPIRILEELVEE
eukprot:TRINITY_DN12279_c0_g1_i1.p1 TRINITY_DN12279_c0_g1~~TRINITY_DN12279_c0_g1_i1.p1  ORF type:complete len:428 (-),score=82.04 TRINITY_DN12279_c0_g1_i1:43-1326(-)